MTLADFFRGSRHLLATRRLAGSVSALGAACLATAVALLLTNVAVACASYPGHNGKFAFRQSGSVALINPDGTGFEYLNVLTNSTSTVGAHPSRSADGKLLVYVCTPCDVPAHDGQLSVVSASGINQSLGIVGNDPARFPNNNTIVFDQSGSLFTIEWAGGPSVPGIGLATLLAPTEGDTYSQPAVSPDGTQVAFTDTSSSSESFIVGLLVHPVFATTGVNSYAANGPATQLTTPTPGAFDSSSDWSPNGSEGVFVHLAAGAASPGLETISEAGGTPTAWPANQDSWTSPKISPDGNLIVATGLPWRPSPLELMPLACTLATSQPDRSQRCPIRRLSRRPAERSRPTDDSNIRIRSI